MMVKVRWIIPCHGLTIQVSELLQLVGGLEQFIFFPSTGSNHPNWRICPVDELIFFRGLEKPQSPTVTTLVPTFPRWLYCAYVRSWNSTWRRCWPPICSTRTAMPWDPWDPARAPAWWGTLTGDRWKMNLLYTEMRDDDHFFAGRTLWKTTWCFNWFEKICVWSYILVNPEFIGEKRAATNIQPAATLW